MNLPEAIEVAKKVLNNTIEENEFLTSKTNVLIDKEVLSVLLSSAEYALRSYP